ncbi:MAG: hypothetical protein LBC70_08730 [Chitinispirillales bacterium]|jgi:hypothetical protein|nr:hypothetical protein [Chitinispirillales bacterium]
MRSVNEKNTYVRFNWLIKVLSYLAVFIIRGDIADLVVDGRWLMLVGFIIYFLGLQLSFRCTSTGFCCGFDFYFFNFYSKIHRWEELRYLEIYPICFTYGILLDTPVSYCFRFVLSNFDKMAELISQNPHIKQKTQQQFINYVNMRKQQSVIRKILPTVLFFIVLYVFFSVEC